MPNDKPSFNFREQDVFFKVQLEHIDADGDERDLSVYMNDNRHHYYIWLEQDHSVGLLKRTIEEGSEWEDITEESQEQLAEISDCWTMLLTCVNMAELYLRNIEVQYVEDILQHNVIQELYSEVEENGGFWDGSKCYSFRQTHTDEDGDLLHGRIEIRTQMKRFIFTQWTMELMFPGIISRPINMASRTCPIWILGAGKHQSGILQDSNNLLLRR